MRILQLISSEGWYGAESMLIMLGKNLSRLGCSPIIGVFRDSRNPHIEVARRAQALGLETELIPCSGRMSLAAVRHIRNLLRVRSIDVVHTHGYKTNLYGFTAAWPSRAALVSTCHSWQGHGRRSMRLYAALDHLVLRRFDRVAAITDMVADALRSSGVHPARVATISNGIETQRGPEVRQVLRAQLGCSSPIVGLVARMIPGKGGEVLLRAMPAVLADCPDARFVFVGGGPCRQEWETMAEHLGVARNVVFTGVRDDMAEIYASLDIVVLPSYTESMPMCLLEAMAAGRPVIATPVGSVGKLVITGRTGLLVEPGDPAGLAQAILLMLRDPVRARELGENGRAHIAANFSSEAMTRRYLQLYDEALEMRTRRGRSDVAGEACQT